MKQPTAQSHPPAPKSARIGRRLFLSAAGSAPLAGMLAAQTRPQAPVTQASVPDDPAAPREQPGTVPASLPFDSPIAFARKDFAVRVRPFPLSQVKLTSSAFLDAQEANRALLRRYEPDRFLHTFRLTAGLPSSAKPLGGWEEPKGELRGHFAGHYLSALALMYASTGDQEMKTRAEYMVTELAKCQDRLGQGYLSAYPTELFDRLKARKRVWAPFYTYHKILAGMLDVHQHCGSPAALKVAGGMADWVDQWTGALTPENLEMVLDEEFGGMNESLYNLAAVSSTPRYGTVGDRFTKKRFFNPLALQRDQLRGLHANTHIPQVIGAARRYELTSDQRFRDVAEFFWRQMLDARTYVTGGTSMNEGWLTEPNHIAQELALGTNTNECCCAYNLMKLARQMYAWSADPRIMDYYERTLYNHRLGTIDLTNGHTQYFLALNSGSWRTFGTEENSFWCCTGTGVEEYAKLADSIYFHDDNAVYVNLFIPSELDWKERGMRIRQTTNFPADPNTRIEILSGAQKPFALKVRIPSWVNGNAAVSINGRASEITAEPGSYVVIQRAWKGGDRVEIAFPMGLHAEPTADNPNLKAFLYGPLVLASRLDAPKLEEALVVGPQGPNLRRQPAPEIAPLRPQDADTKNWRRASGPGMSFEVPGAGRKLAFVPFNSIGPGERYAIYWKVG